MGMFLLGGFEILTLAAFERGLVVCSDSLVTFSFRVVGRKAEPTEIINYVILCFNHRKVRTHVNLSANLVENSIPSHTEEVCVSSVGPL